MTNLDEFEFRSANENEMSQVHALMSYVFADPPDDSPPLPVLPQWTQCAFKNQKLAATSAIFPFVMRMNGKATQMQGVTGVGTEPEYRRRGLVRHLIQDLLLRGHEQGDTGSVLLASRGAIYQRFGYGQASTLASYEFDPRDAAFETNVPTTGHLERLSKSEALPLIKTAYKASIKNRNMLAHRSQETWAKYVKDMDAQKSYAVVHFDNANEPQGYCLYKTVWVEEKQILTITDFYYTNMDTYRAIWNYVISHDLVGTVKWQFVAEDDPAIGLLLEPRMLRRKTWDGLWYRVIDVTASLLARNYDVDGSTVINISGDDLCPWNNGTYQLTVTNGDASVTLSTEEPEISCSINELASLLSGYSSVAWLEQIGRLSVRDTSRLGSLNALFATFYRPALAFDF